MSTPPNSTSPESFEIPNPFGRYTILRKLGQGGMGSVYLAEDSFLKRRVALKVPRELAGENPEVVARFRREAQMLAAFQHPNICRVLDVGEFAGRHYLTMEYHEGKPLDSVLVPGKPMKPAQAARIVRKLALALQKAHDRGIVHRDLKPANVLLTTEKDLIILDFGLARAVEQGSHKLSLTGDLFGTPAYMSPEQVKGDPSQISTTTDVYSLGVMLYELLCGRRPFNGPVTMVLLNVVNDPPEPPSKFRPRLDPRLEAVCLKALEKDPAARHASMAEFARALSEWLAGQSVTADPTEEPLVREEADSAGTGRRGVLRTMLFAAVAVILMTLGIAVGKRVIPSFINGPGRERDDNGLQMKLCWCPPGKFTMGSPPDEKGREDHENQVEVTLTRGFWLGKFEVTQGQWLKVMGTTPAEQKAIGAYGDVRGEGPDHPMAFVDYAEAEAFCRRWTISERAAGRLPAGWEYRLPTEAQWEYACRAGGKGPYGLSDDDARLEDCAWFNTNSRFQTHRVGLLLSNDFKLHDMLGNVWEWCRDGYSEKLPGGIDPLGPPEAPKRVFRGGSFDGDSSCCRPAFRRTGTPGNRSYSLGFRVALVQSGR